MRKNRQVGCNRVGFGGRNRIELTFPIVPANCTSLCGMRSDVLFGGGR